MKDCLKCDNKIPSGRVVSMCDGCLALRVYGRALDRIVEITQGSEFGTFGRIHAIATRALRSVPRRLDETPSE